MDKKNLKLIKTNQDLEHAIEGLDEKTIEPDSSIDIDNTLQKEYEATEEKEQLKNDKIVAKDYLSVFAEQDDRGIFYEVSNIYKNEKTKEYKNKFSLKKDPPILEIKDTLGEEVHFILTENVVKEMIHSLKEVERAYSGFSGPLDIKAPKKLKDKIVYYFKRKPMKFLFPIILMIIIVILSII